MRHYSINCIFDKSFTIFYNILFQTFDQSKTFSVLLVNEQMKSVWRSSSNTFFYKQTPVFQTLK